MTGAPGASRTDSALQTDSARMNFALDIALIEALGSSMEQTELHGARQELEEQRSLGEELEDDTLLMMDMS